MSPLRIQIERTPDWTLPAGAVIVDRTTPWGNPFLLGDVAHRFPSLTTEQCHAFVVNEFRDLIGSLMLRERHDYPSDDEIRDELGGKDLACWCPLDEACHIDVLLEIANTEEDQ